MAWKRGVQNNLPGEIRKGHIREFLMPSSKLSSVSTKLKIIDCVEMVSGSKNAAIAFVSSKVPDILLPFVHDNLIRLHAHEHPRNVITAMLTDQIPEGCILLNEAQRINSKVCSGESEEWTVYQGDRFAYDAREGAMGDTEVRASAKPPPNANKILFSVRPLPGETPPYFAQKSFVETDAKVMCMLLSKSLQDCIVTVETIYTVEVDGIEFVCRIEKIEEETDIDVNEEEQFELPDTYRGIVLPMTEMFVLQDENGSRAASAVGFPTWHLVNIVPMPSTAPSKNIVNILTSDDEVFPVLRRLLRPCIALTSVVQAGHGIYKQQPQEGEGGDRNTTSSNSTGGKPSNHPSYSNSTSTEEAAASAVHEVWVDVDACTFDRVLLYLEHEARGDQFKFDPTIAVELREAAITLGITGLRDICDKVLGSFNERVRRTPIRLSEVIARNTAGASASVGASAGFGNDTNTRSSSSAVSSNSRSSSNGINGSSSSTGTESKSTTSTSSSASTAAAKPTTTERKKASRSETLLIMSGMVFDITRWLDEHPGGSNIIPEQGLNVDATVFFEIYHASKQSFLYLREFYIGELAEEDVPLVPKPSRGGGWGVGLTGGQAEEASEAFMEQLARLTPWRLRKEDLVIRTVRNL